MLRIFNKLAEKYYCKEIKYIYIYSIQELYIYSKASRYKQKNIS